MPEWLLKSSGEHFKRDVLWKTEGRLISEDISGFRQEPPDQLWFFVTPRLDVYPNCGTLEPWWRLGNLNSDSPGVILSRFLQDATPGLRSLLNDSPEFLCGSYGDAEGERIYSGLEELISLYRGKHLQQTFL